MSGRVTGWALVLYGVLGFALVVGGAAIGLDAATRIERLAGDAAGTLEAAARSTRAAADSFTSVDSSLAEAQSSADEAAALARNAGGTLEALAISMQVSIFGTQPLISLADEFATSADDALALADTLGNVGGSLSDTRTDVAVIGTELDSLSDQLDALGSRSDEDAPPLRPFVLVLLAWIATPSLGALVYGSALILRRRSALPA